MNDPRPAVELTLKGNSTIIVRPRPGMNHSNTGCKN